MRLLDAGRLAHSKQRLAEMLSAARDIYGYGVDAALLSCSAIPPPARSYGAAPASPSSRSTSLLAAADRLWRHKPDAIVLAQVSMARQAARLTARLGIPVFSSLASSPDALRAVVEPRC